jgi:hypothetical protein
VGLAAVATGGVAVFKAEDGTGTAALILGGLLLLLFGVAGDRITKLRHGDTEVVFEFVEEAAQADASGDVEAASLFLDAALRRVSPQGEAEPPQSSPLQYESQVQAVLRDLWPIEVARTSLDRGVDAALEVKGLRIAVEVKAWSSNFALRTVIDRMGPQLRQAGFDGLLLVLKTAAQSARTGWGSQHISQASGLPVEVLGWHPADGATPLREAIDRLVQRVRADKNDRT